MLISDTNGIVWLDNVQCTGNETSIDMCLNDGLSVHKCTTNSLFAAVNCHHKGIAF